MYDGKWKHPGFRDFYWDVSQSSLACKEEMPPSISWVHEKGRTEGVERRGGLGQAMAEVLAEVLAKVYRSEDIKAGL